MTIDFRIFKPLSFDTIRPQISAMTSNSPDIKLKETPVRAPSHVPVDDAVLPFEVASLDLRGRLTRLGPGLDDLLAKHDYPPPVAKLLGEAVVLTTLLGSSLKFNGRFILQTQTDGPVSFLIVDFQAPDRLRAYARFDAKEIKEGQDSGSLLGKGHLAMTIDQGPDMSRYQGLVALDGGGLEDAAHEYFTIAEDDAWIEGQSLISTVEDVELIDPDLSGERLLYRLFHERGVRVFAPLALQAKCSCSREAVSGMLKSFEPQDRAEMVKDGKVVVTCEFCSSVYEFTPQEAGVE
jgi:redox-regulated HSP33 family molecular chaperone